MKVSPQVFEDVPVTAPLKINEPYHIVIGKAVEWLVQYGRDVFIWQQDRIWWIARETDGVYSGLLSGESSGGFYLAQLRKEGTAPGDPFLHILSRVYFDKRRKPR